MKFVHLLVLLVCLLSVVVEASRWERFKGWVSKKGTKAKHAKNKVETAVALDGLKRFEMRDATSCNAKQTQDNCKGVIGKLFVGEAAAATSAGLTAAKVAGAAVGVGPAIVGAVGAGAGGLSYYCGLVKDLCSDLREFDLKIEVVHNQLKDRVPRRG
ncbi:hypothetical protein Ae201684P_012645 [Aphanomyces euteiches]|uniref:Glycine zipper domain-containing protein n=1 Tax=Aphanomyces euteiches TaxID=100861 RepID=A0A6G0W9J2_9STRA|nr:hypothetical protein Ae201684_017601 [Aphanomyces euteiches]KAH9076157.1 hypothetical protein Ae201684P_012645 [Aphanomyces euteiches]